LFLGKYSAAIDQEGRFVAPPAYRQQLLGGLYMLRGFDRNLLVFPQAPFENIYRSLTSQNIADPLARLLLRLLLGTAHELELDASGNLVIPAELQEFAELTPDLLLVGQGDYFEVWQPDLWRKQEIQLNDVGANSNRFSALLVATR
jgi:MraZ protein